MSQTYTWPAAVTAAPPVGGATAANQVLEIAQLTAINNNTDTLEAGQATGNASLASIDSKTPALGQQTMANSSPVVIASDQSPIAVTGPLTDTQLRAVPVPVSGTVSTGGLTDAELRASPVPVTQSSQPLPTGAATSANQTTEIASIDAFSAKTAAGLVPEAFDYQEITYVGATTDIDTVEFRLGGAGGTLVATLTMGYDGSNRLSTVTKT